MMKALFLVAILWPRCFVDAGAGVGIEKGNPADISEDETGNGVLRAWVKGFFFGDDDRCPDDPLKDEQGIC